MIGAGSFGEVCLSWWEGGHVDVAVKANGVSCLNAAAIDNERQLLELLLQHPHKNILVVYGIVMDAPDGNVRLVMAHCPGGGLDGYLNTVRESREVCANRFNPDACSQSACFASKSQSHAALLMSPGTATGDVDHHPAAVRGWHAPHPLPRHHPS